MAEAGEPKREPRLRDARKDMKQAVAGLYA